MSFDKHVTILPNSLLSLSLDLNKSNEEENILKLDINNEFTKFFQAGSNTFAAASLGIEQIPQVQLVRDLHGPGPTLTLPCYKGAAASSPSCRPPE